MNNIEINDKIVKNKRKVFISYSAKDFDVIQRIISGFKENNIEYWIDDEQIQPGCMIDPQIRNGLKISQFILLCFSQNQVKLGWLRNEYKPILDEMIINEESKKRIIPLILDDLDEEKIPIFLRGTHYRFTNKQEYGKLIALFRKTSS